MMEIRIADFADPQVSALLHIHLQGMHANSPAGNVFALDESGLIARHVRVYGCYDQRKLLGIGALKQLDNDSAEIKSMRTHPDHLRKGVAIALLEHMIAQAKHRGCTDLFLETGSGAAFDAAIQLYLQLGFTPGPAFSSYTKSEFNQFFHLPLHPTLAPK